MFVSHKLPVAESGSLLCTALEVRGQRSESDLGVTGGTTVSQASSLRRFWGESASCHFSSWWPCNPGPCPCPHLHSRSLRLSPCPLVPLLLPILTSASVSEGPCGDIRPPRRSRVISPPMSNFCFPLPGSRVRMRTSRGPLPSPSPQTQDGVRWQRWTTCTETQPTGQESPHAGCWPETRGHVGRLFSRC